MILRIGMQNHSYVKRNDFAYSNATSLLYNMGVDDSVPLRYLNDAFPLINRRDLAFNDNMGMHS